MSEINLNNYEAYMLDFFEGKLSNEQIIALKAFAVLHPELDLNFEDELVELEKETIHFSDKQKLKVNFNEELVIGYLENTLNKEEKKEADTLLRTNTVFINELNLYKKTIAQPDEQIVFENKAQLKREPKIIFFSQTALARIAATITLLIGLWLLINRTLLKEGVSVPEMAKTENKNIISPNEKNNTLDKEVQKPIEVQLALSVAKQSSSKKTSKHTQSIEADPITTTDTNATVNPVANNSSVIENTPKITFLDTNAVKLAANTPEKKNKYVIEVGSDDEYTASAAQPKKNKLLSLASKAFKKLNQNGIGKINGSDNDDALYIGALTISKTAN